jgi:hypothetical protein
MIMYYHLMRGPEMVKGRKLRLRSKAYKEKVRQVVEYFYSGN